MATFDKDIIEDYGSLDAFAKADGCFRIYESDSNFHVMRKPADEDQIMNNPFVRNPRLVWERGRGSINLPVKDSAEHNKSVNTLMAAPAVNAKSASSGGATKPKAVQPLPNKSKQEFRPEATNTHLITEIRKNYNLLLFLVLTSIPLVFWWLLMLIFFAGGMTGMPIIMVFFFPLIAAPVVGSLVILITKFLSTQIGYLLFWVLGGLGIIAMVIGVSTQSQNPIIIMIAIAGCVFLGMAISAFVLGTVGHLVTRKLYTGDKNNIPAILPG